MMSCLNTAINKLDIHQYSQFQLLLKIVLPDCINEKACITYVKDQRLLLLCTSLLSFPSVFILNNFKKLRIC